MKNMNQKTDKELICNACSRPFIFSVNDQEFYARQGWGTIPKKCRACRIKREEKNAKS